MGLTSGRATLESGSNRNSRIDNNNGGTGGGPHKIRITANPLSMNYCEPEDCVPSSFSNPTHIELPSDSAEPAPVSHVDSATYCKSKAPDGSATNNNSNANNDEIDVWYVSFKVTSGITFVTKLFALRIWWNFWMRKWSKVFAVSLIGCIQCVHILMLTIGISVIKRDRATFKCGMFCRIQCSQLILFQIHSFSLSLNLNAIFPYSVGFLLSFICLPWHLLSLLSVFL